MAAKKAKLLSRPIEPVPNNDVSPASDPGESGVRPRTYPVPGLDAVPVVSRADFVMACEAARNPHARAIEAISVEIANGTGLLHAGNRRRFDAFNSIVSYAYPAASLPRGLACSEWSNWLFFFDDVHDEDEDVCRDVTRVGLNMEHHLHLMRFGGDARDASAQERLTIDLHARLLPLGGRAWLDRFCSSAADYLLKGVLPAVENWAQRRTPKLDAYLEQREHDSSMASCIDMIELAQEVYLPDSILLMPEVQRARRACARTVAYFNDIVSFPKEVLKAENPNNLVFVLMNEHKLSLAGAVQEATAIVNDNTRDMLAAIDEVERLVPGEHAWEVDIYLRGMKQWQRGNVDWSLDGERYASPWSPVAELFRPTSR